jgi:hypothetical protein
VRQSSLLYKRHRFPGEIISHAVWLYYRFLLSYRDVEELLAERGRTERGTWHRFRVVLYGQTVTPLVCCGTALWYTALRDRPIRFVIVRDPSGRRHDEAFFCTDRSAGVAFILAAYARRWALEVTFFDCKQGLGFEDPQNQAVLAVRRTAPFAGLVYALVVLWAAHELAAGAVLATPRRPWYRHKAGRSFADLLATLRQTGSARVLSSPPRFPASPCPPRRHQKACVPRQAFRCALA